jgi:hypothetical protein
MRTIVAAVVALLGMAVLASGRAEAYPQWQFSSGTSRCNQCHFSPAGTGAITNYGRDAVGEDLSSFEGNGGFLHGAVELPAWLALGFDTRLAYLRHQNGNPDGPMTALFPMQADVYLRLAFADSFSLSVTGGYRGQARSSPAGLGDDNYYPASADRVVSREHYLMWRAGALGAYVRAGRFFAPYGLRLAEHTTYVRRDLGFNLLDETYGLSGGYVHNEWEVHVTGFIPDVLRSFGAQEKGAAAMFEYRLADAYALGADGRVGFSDDVKKYGGGIFAKAYVAPIRTILMGQVDLVQVQGSSGVAANQLVAYVGPTIIPVRGVWLSAFAEVNQTDIKVKGTATQALNGQLNWFPYPHFELIVLGRMQSPRDQEAAKTLLLQLHYFL